MTTWWTRGGHLVNRNWIPPPSLKVVSAPICTVYVWEGSENGIWYKVTKAWKKKPQHHKTKVHSRNPKCPLMHHLSAQGGHTIMEHIR